MPHHSTPDYYPAGILCPGGNCENSANPHWCWISDYSPFGFEKPATSWIADSMGYRYGFQKQETDDELFGDGNASFFKFRISDNRIGRFFAVDPLAPEYPWNSPYAFSENRVIDGIELEGLEVVSIHGTWGNEDESYFSKKMEDNLKDVFGNTQAIRPKWSGENKDIARKMGAESIASRIENIRAFNPKIKSEPVTIIGHSHGGNIAVMVVNILVNKFGYDPKSINLITLNTPVREYQLVGDARKINHYNIFNYNDLTQIAGGIDNIEKNPSAYEVLNLANNIYSGVAIFQLLSTGRKFDAANNIPYDHQKSKYDFSNHMGNWQENVDVWMPLLRQTVFMQNQVPQAILDIQKGKSESDQPNQ